MKEYYTHLLNSFALFARSSNIDVNYAPQKTFFYRFPTQNDESHVRALRPLHLRNCKTPSGAVVDILVSFSEWLDAKDEKVTIQSRVAVAYFNVDLNQNRAALLLGLHYDFDPCNEHNEPWMKHPRFHAQISPDVITAQQIALVADTFPYRCPAVPSVNISEIARIPTAHMCLGSVLVCLAADFFSEEDFKSFMAAVREYTNIYPRPRTKEMLENILADKNSLRSCAWYHRPPRQSVPANFFKGTRKRARRKA
jgi:hypothetical protein